MNNCLFNIFYTLTGNGGAICIDNPILFMNINDTTFYECKILNGIGGAIYFKNGSHVQFSRICAKFCKASSAFSFAHFYTINNQFFDMISVTECSYSSNTVSFQGFGHKILNSNISNNINSVNSACTYWCPDMYGNYCSFNNNTATNYICMCFSSYSGNIYRCNIINNNSPSYGVFYVMNLGQYSLHYCNFKDNQNTLFCITTGSVTLNTCYYISGSSSSIGYVAKSFISTISYYISPNIVMSYFCKSPSPSISRSPSPSISQSPSPSISQSPSPSISQSPSPSISRSPSLSISQSPSPSISQSPSSSNSKSESIDEITKTNNYIIESSTFNFLKITQNSLISVENNLLEKVFSFKLYLFSILILFIIIIFYLIFKNEEENDSEIIENLKINSELTNTLYGIKETVNNEADDDWLKNDF